MINVNQITAKLATLPDQALQQYAMMNKNDPYIMSLALSESTRRQEIRNAAQGAQGGMQEPPKVVDQVVAGMSPQPAPQSMGQPMPEDVGIGQLPAGDMEFADGGIISFAEGRVIPGARKPNESFAEYRRRLLELENQRAKTKDAEEAAAREEERKRRLAERGEPVIPPSPFFDRVPLPNRDAEAAATLPTPTPDQKAKTQAAKERADAEVDRAAAAGESYPDVPAARPLYERPPEIATEAPSKAPPAAPEKPSFVPGPTGINVDETGLGALMSMDDYRKRFGMDVLDKEAAGLEAQLRAVGAKEIKGKQDYLSGIKEDIAALGEYGVDREAKLNKQLKELEGKEDKNVSMALLEAGLAMMAGTSQYAFENIGKGALVGTKAYKEGLDKIEAKRDILDERIANLMDIRRNETRANKKEIRAAEAGVAEAESALAKSLYTNTKDMLGMKKDTANAAATAYSNDQITRAKILSDRQVADAQIRAGDRRTAAQITSAEKIAALPGAELQKLAALDPSGKGDARAGYEEQQRIIAQYSSEGKFNLDKAYADYFKDVSPQAQLSGTKVLTKTEYAALFGRGVVNAVPKGSRVKPG